MLVEIRGYKLVDSQRVRGWVGSYWLRLRAPIGFMVVLVSSLLCGCSLVSDKALNYQDAKTVVPLTTPADVADPRRGQAYPVPALSRSAGASRAFIPTEAVSVPRNVSAADARGMKQVKMERFANDRPYLVVSRPKGDVYASVRQFVKANKLGVEAVDEAAGVVKLAPLKPVLQSKKPWWQLGKTKPQRDQFTLKVVEGGGGRSTVVMSHQIWERGSSQESEWNLIRTNDPKDFDSAEAILSDLGHFIDADEKGWRSPMVARRYESLPSVVRSVDGTGYPVITVVSDYNQAWGRVESALAASDQVQLEDKNRSEGIFLVKVRDAEGLLQLRLDRVETGVVITLQRDDNTLAPLSLTESVITELENVLQA